MTKSSQSRIARKKSRQEVAKTAMNVAAHGRLIEVEIDGQKVQMWAMPASAHQVVMQAFEYLSR